ncbi:Aca2/YdiL-like domain-containing protein [Undibacterium umbellatum]|uniref:DUF1870 family protein n=1 Tax=Undibacterium umbellatum TaxID=2762300 RepID=A0ABR6Z349_9BURK|nr:DUF1870 family protein [Undibacterium umbellatum]MBC3906125.1 DUF1870 family protein [Undibacterium umbellatum]
MNGVSLKAMRSLLRFSHNEAAELIGGVPVRTWSSWEAGTQKIPQDVISMINYLMVCRKKAITDTQAAIKTYYLQMPPGTSKKPVALVWYDSFEDWCTLPYRESIMWRPQQSVVAHLISVENCSVVQFEAEAYEKWLGRRPDSDSMRNQWADEQSLA